ncbi:MAG: Fe-S cluster assembly ATPase SufC [Nanoarchaeota archaeon]|nr:Fe-S cluster assembly ATPase SufC [Nanoarchaeota archaeon]
MTLQIKNLHATHEGKEILKGVNLKLEKGKVHALMGPNGSGKTTLSYILMGHPKYKITKGEIIFDGKNITNFSPDEKAKLGIFLSFQNPISVPGVTLSNFLRQAYNSIHSDKLSLLEFRQVLGEKANVLGVDVSFLSRYLNEGFSGGEKKKAEALQLLILNPKLAILDETDSGLDIDSLKLVSKGISDFMNPEKYILIITHYKKILEYIKPDKISIIIDGRIVNEGSADLVEEIEEKGYDWASRS